MRPALLLLLLCAATARAEAPGDIGAALRAGRWDDAAVAAAGESDPVALELVRFYRLLSPAGGRSAEVAAFMADHPDWPMQPVLARRLAGALALDHDDAGVLAVCARPGVPVSLRCAEVTHPPDPAADARRAWLAGGFTDPVGEAAFLARWGRTLTPDEQWQRFDRLAWSDSGALGGPAARQAARLDPVRRALGLARLAFRRDDPAAVPVPGVDTADPGLFLEEAKWLRRRSQDQAALATWLRAGAAVEAAAPPERRTLFWNERNLLARRLLQANDAAGAYTLVAAHAQTGEAMLDAEFLAGWIALRRLNRPTEAAGHFARLAAGSRAVITQARAHYWLARTREAQEDAGGARAEYELAAHWPTAWYGQLAARALGDLSSRLATLRDPGWDTADVSVLAETELPRAALLLASWGEDRRGRLFLQRLEELAPEPPSRALVARLADSLGWPDAAVGAGRRAGRDGIMLPDAGWPKPVAPPGSVEGAFALAVMRQESGFDPEAASPAGARGLMQLMPATAAAVARRTGDAAGGALADPALNMRLGTAYLHTLLDEFGGSMPLAAAAYNAGASRVSDWLAANGDPRGSNEATLVDWVELIPFNETRNYVQRVMENVELYRAKAAPGPNG